MSGGIEVNLVRDGCIYVLVMSTLLSYPFSETICHAPDGQDLFSFVIVDVAAVRELIVNKTKKLHAEV